MQAGAMAIAFAGFLFVPCVPWDEAAVVFAGIPFVPWDEAAVIFSGIPLTAG
jgi:hypothetical protein